MPVPVARAQRRRGPPCCAGPNDPTGEVRADRARATHWLILDEALAGFLPDGEDRIVDHPRVIHVRSFSKAHALAGLRIGYAIVPDGGPDLAPVLGVGAPALAARAVGGRERRRVRAAAGATGPRRSARGWRRSSTSRPATVPTPGWRVPVAEELAARRIYVAPGSAWGEEGHVRVTLHDEAATDRLLVALRETNASTCR